MITPEVGEFNPGQDDLKVVYNGLMLALQTSQWLEPRVTRERHFGLHEREFRVARLSEAVSRVILGERIAEYSEVLVRSRTNPKDSRDPSWVGVVLRETSEDYHWLNPGTGATELTVHKDPVLSKVFSITKQVPWSTVEHGAPVVGASEAGVQSIVFPVISRIEDPLEAGIMEEIIRDMRRVTPDDMALLDRAVLAVSAEA